MAGRTELDRERIAMVALLAVAALGRILGVANTPGYGPHGAPEQALNLLRLLATAALLLALLLGPGVVWRLTSRRFQLTDIVAELVMIGFGATLATLVWKSAAEVE